MHEDRTPEISFLKIILPAAAGIAVALLTDISWVVPAVCCAAAIACAWLTMKRTVSQAYVWAAVFLFFFAVAELRTPRSELPAGERVALTVQIREMPYAQGRWQQTTADVGYYRLAPYDASPEDHPWHKVNERIQLSIDTIYHDIGPGTQLAFEAWFNPIDTTGSSYGQLMGWRGQHGRAYLTPGNMLSVAPHVSKTPAYYAAKWQATALGRLERLSLPPSAHSVVSAMTVGDKRSVDRTLRGDYSRSGAAHLLAVSGLHVGIVFILINIVLYLLPAFRRGHIVKNVVAVAAIWLYAMTAGLSPSVVRAALMFSFAQAALATTSYRNALNIMLGSAVIMLAVNPNYAFDPSFLLSYAAVISICLFFGPLYGLVRTRWKALNALLSVLVVGLVATLGTAPLVSYWFGNLPVAGLLINPAVIATAHLIVMAGVLWIIFPLGFLRPVFAWTLTLAADIQNALVSWSASLSWGAFSVSLPLWGVFVIYAVYMVVAVWIYNRPHRKKISFGI